MLLLHSYYDKVMNKATKIRLYTATALLIVLAVLSFRPNKSDHQGTVLEQPESKKSETVQKVPLTDLEANSDTESEAKKIMPVMIPILMYHYIRAYSRPSDPIGENLSVAPEKFEEQIAWLKENGYRSVSLDLFEIPEPVSFKPLVLTFDDGYQDAFDMVFPILRKYEMPGIFYLIVNKIGTPGYLTWDEIVQMQESGMRFGSHTLTHPDLRNLSVINLEKELKESKKILEQKLGKEITDFCYPSGKYDSAVLREVRVAGYQTAVTTVPGIATVKSNPYLLERLRITQNTKIQGLLPK